MFVLILLDARSCYDRISPPIASLSMIRQGAPQQCVAIMFNTIQEMQHFIRTSYGDSDKSYKSSNEIKFHGILQGNGAGPTVWALVSSPLLDRLRVKKCGVALVLVDGETIQIPAFAFVDDVDLIQELTNRLSLEEAKTAIDEWQDGLRATGGELVPEKCKSFIIHPTWKDDKWSWDTGDNSANKLYIKDENGVPIEILQCDANTGQLALGLCFSPIGGTVDEVQRLKQKVESWAEHVRTGHLTRQEAWQCLNTTVMKTIDYSLPASILSKSDYENIMTPALKIGLPRSGICRTILRSITYSSIRYQGLGIRNPFWMQGIYKICTLFNNHHILTHKLLDVSWLRTVQETGLGEKFWEYDFRRMEKNVTKGWISSVWEFLHLAENIEVRRMDGLGQRVQRFAGDKYIMHLILERTELKGEDLRQFNCCRLFLQVELLSDIVTANGTKIQQDTWSGDERSHRQSYGPITRHPRPSEKAWKKWRAGIRQILNTSETGKLGTPLPVINTTTDWVWFYHEDTM